MRLAPLYHLLTAMHRRSDEGPPTKRNRPASGADGGHLSPHHLSDQPEDPMAQEEDMVWAQEDDMLPLEHLQGEDLLNSTIKQGLSLGDRYCHRLCMQLIAFIISLRYQRMGPRAQPDLCL